MTALKIAVVGGRRGRTGLGPFVARDLAAAGADVTALVATSEATCAAAQAQMQCFAGVAPRAYRSVETLLSAESLDAVAICSPHGNHAETLERALAARLHVLCEKPLVWGAGAADRAERISRSFREQGRVLFENCQWPYALPAFAKLHPGALEHAPQRFVMHLQPAARGAEMLADALPHALSLLQHLAPAEAPRLEAVQTSPREDGEALSLHFDYVADGARVAARVELRRREAAPRELCLEIDGQSARRCIDTDYQQSFESAGRRVPFADPMTQLVAEFAACAAAGRDPDAGVRTRRIAARAMLLETLTGALAEA